ncbi:MAG: BPL-N domain-containing protein [Pseudonocardia sp.]
MTDRLALVYRGKAARPVGCAEAVAAALLGTGMEVRFVGPKEELRLTPGVLDRAALYAQPGGGELGPAYRRMRRRAGVLRDYVAGGGCYLGFCLGGYLAGATPGFGLLPGDTDQYLATDGATVDHDGDALVEVAWRGRRRWLYAQDAPVFLLDGDLDRDTSADVLARYPNGTVAALVAPFGAGAVGVVGPHPEAGADWFADAGLPVPGPPAHDLVVDLATTTLRRAARGRAPHTDLTRGG